MKKLLLSLILCAVLYGSPAQVSYYKAEWTKKGKSELFTGICKIETDRQGLVKGEIVWVYVAIDSTSEVMVDYYKGKKGRMGIEYVEGNYSRDTHDLVFEGKRKEDPYEVIGLDKYTLKISANKQVLYGITATEGTHEGLMYAVKLPDAAGEKEFLSAKATVKKAKSSL